MTQIKKVKTSEGVQFYPQTHTKAVIDDNGYTAESRLGAMQDEINHAQLAVGAVPSDLAPAEGSTNWVTSGGVFNATTVGDNVEIDLTLYTTVAAFPNPSNWAVNYESYAGKFIPITPLKRYKITANASTAAHYGFLTTNAYSKNDAVSYATGCNRIKLDAGTDNIDEAPADARYLYIATYTSADCTPSKVEAYNKSNLREVVSEMVDAQEELEEKFVHQETVYSNSNVAVPSNTVYYVNPSALGLLAGHTYHIDIYTNDNSNVPAQVSFYLRQVKTQSTPNITLCTVPQGSNSISFSYTPVAETNYQYITSWSTSAAPTMSFTIKEVIEVDKAPFIYDSLGKSDNGAVSQRAMTEILEDGTFLTLIEISLDSSLMTKTPCSLGSQSLWINQNGCNHITIPCSEGDTFSLSHTGNDNFYGWLASYTTPSGNETVDYVVGTNRMWASSDLSLTAPAGVEYLCLVTKNGDGYSTTWEGTAEIKKPLHDILGDMALKSDVNDVISTTFRNEINKYIHVPSSYIPIKETKELYGSTSCSQGCALYGNYLVSIANSSVSSICIYDLVNKTKVAASVALPTFANTRTHGNTISFSNVKYDSGDDFPLLYICSGYTDNTSASTSEVYVVRIVNTEGTYSTELIQTITIDFGIINGWTEFVVDAGNNRAWITGTGVAFYICVALPSIGEDVLINASTPIIDYFDIKYAALGVSTNSSGQNRCFYHGRIYAVSGVPGSTGQGEDALFLSVDNTLTHCREAIASLKNYGITTEPEACFIWNDNIYVVMLGGYIYKLLQN